MELLASLGEVLSASQWQGLSSNMRRILEKLCQRIQELTQELAQLKEELAQLKEEKEDLREELEADSSNSIQASLFGSRIAKPPPTLPEAFGSKAGVASLGHPGQPRKLFAPEQCRKVEDHYPEQCKNCGGSNLEDCQEPPYRHQVVEIPPIELLIDELRLHWQRCQDCGGWTRAELPDGVSEEGYGPRLTALIALYGSFLRASYRMTQALMSDLFGVDVSLGTIRKLRDRVSKSVASAVEDAKQYVRNSPVVHADETSYRQGNADGENPKNLGGWLWVIAAPQVAYFEIHLSRGKEVAQKLLGLSFAGILASDRYKGYAWVDVVSPPTLLGSFDSQLREE